MRKVRWLAVGGTERAIVMMTTGNGEAFSVDLRKQDLVGQAISSRSPAGPLRSSVSIWLALLFNLYFLLFFPGAELAVADGDRAVLQAQLKQLPPITSIELMAVPYGVAFAVRLNEKRLPKNSCLYRIDSTSGSTSDELLRILDDSVLEYQPGARKKIELRLGIILKVGNDPVQEFYFEDWGRNRSVEGFSGNYRILTSPDFTTLLRALVMHPAVILIRDLDHSCPHS